jgi:hypothetical protein
MTLQEAIAKAIEGGYPKERVADLSLPVQAQYPYSDTSRACSSSTRICGGAIGCFPSLLTTAKP